MPWSRSFTFVRRNFGTRNGHGSFNLRPKYNGSRRWNYNRYSGNFLYQNLVMINFLIRTVHTKWSVKKVLILFSYVQHWLIWKSPVHDKKKSIYGFRKFQCVNEKNTKDNDNWARNSAHLRPVSNFTRNNNYASNNGRTKSGSYDAAESVAYHERATNSWNHECGNFQQHDYRFDNWTDWVDHRKEFTNSASSSITIHHELL